MTDVTHAIILAGGKATRMRPFTEDAPKALVPVGGLPMIERQLDWLIRNAIQTVTVSCGYRYEMIVDHVKNLDLEDDLVVDFAIEANPLGRGGGMKNAAARMAEGTDPVLVMNGDVLTDMALLPMRFQHELKQAMVTMALAPYRSNWGVAEVDEMDRVRGFVQSPLLPYWINAGIYLMDREVFELLPDVGDHEDSTFPKLAEAGRMAAYRIPGYWRGVDTVKDVLAATEELAQRGAQ